MEHITVGRKFNEGKVAFVECVKNGSLDNIGIKNKCFLLIILTKGKLEFKVGGEKVLLHNLCKHEKWHKIQKWQSGGKVARRLDRL